MRILAGRRVERQSGNTPPRRVTRARRLARQLASGIALATVLTSAAPAAQLAGVTLPDSITVSGTKLVLNGVGLRKFSMLGVHIYVAGLYLTAPNHDPAAILASPAPKMLLLHFVHNVPADKVRDAWRKGLQANCVTPCTLAPAELSRFLSFLPAMANGETVALVFSHQDVRAYFDGKLGGTVTNANFAKVMLEVWLGHSPAAPGLKAALLGTPD